jgi:mono/diheme cytochrome c family protein
MAPFIFIGVWIVIALALLFVGMRGGPRGARDALQSQSRGSRRFAALVFLVIFVGLGVGVPAALLIGNHANASKRFKGVQLSSEDRRGRDLFSLQCVSCHTLKAARAAGKVGPNLDDLKPPKSLVLDAIVTGRIRGNGTMPARLLQGRDADAVADFVAKVAGQ